MSEEVKETSSQVEYDYSEKTLYDEVGVTIDNVTEEVEKKCDDLLKKYNPIDNPNNLEKYQKILYTKSVIGNESLRNFYDDHEEYSTVLFNCIQKIFPMRVMNPKKYIKINIYSLVGMVVLVALFIILFALRLNKYVLMYWRVAFLPVFIIDFIYLIYFLVKVLKDIMAMNKSKKLKIIKEKKNNEKKEVVDGVIEEEVVEDSYTGKDKPIKKILIENSIQFLKFALFVILQTNIINYLENMKTTKLNVIEMFSPHFAYEAVELLNNICHFMIVLKTFMKKEEPTSESLKENGALRYAIGCAKNPSCILVKPKGKGKESESKGKKNAQVKCSGNPKIVLLGIFNSYFGNQIYRVSQVLLILYGLTSETPVSWTLLLLPTLIAPFVKIINMIIQSKNGYKEKEDTQVMKIVQMILYTLLMVSAFSLCIATTGIIKSKMGPYLIPFVELIFLALVLVGLTFILSIESNMKKKDE